MLTRNECITWIQTWIKLVSVILAPASYILCEKIIFFYCDHIIACNQYFFMTIPNTLNWNSGNKRFFRKLYITYSKIVLKMYSNIVNGGWYLILKNVFKH